MRIYATFNNQQMEIALIRALARIKRDAEYVDFPENADVFVLVTKGKGFGCDDISQHLKAPKPKVLVTDNDVLLSDEADEVITPTQEGGKLKIRISDIAAAVAKVAPMEFIIEDDIGDTVPEFEIEDDSEPDSQQPVNETKTMNLKERLAQVLQKDHEEIKTSVPAPSNQNIVESFLSRAEHVCVLKGVKGGVGVTTVAAMINNIFDIDVLHLEVSNIPTGFVYYGTTVSGAVAGGRYAFTDGKTIHGEPHDIKLLLVDLSQSASQDVEQYILRNANCVTLVTDREEIAFQMTKSYLEKLRPGLLIVTKTFPGVGNGMEVYEGEYARAYGFKAVIGLPGSLDDERAILYAQRKHVSPCGHSVDLDKAAGEVVAALRANLNI